MQANGVAFASCDAALGFVGFLDIITTGRCAGWLFAPEAPRRTIVVEAYRDDVLIGAGKCLHARADISETYPDATLSGFDFPLNWSEQKRPYSRLSIRVHGSSHEVLGGPFFAVNRVGMVSIARHAGQRSHRMRGDGIEAAAGALLQSVLRDRIVQARRSDTLTLLPATPVGTPTATRRQTIIIPVYRDVAITRDCIESVLATRTPTRDRVLLIEDASPDFGMRRMLAAFAQDHENVVLLCNPANQGFVRTVNRGFDFCRDGDVLLLNSDTRLFAGAIDEMRDVLHAAPDIGTVTALSNNATIFSYPHPDHDKDVLPDIDWESLAAVARAQSAGSAVEVPTGHGFCMLIREEALRQLGGFSEAFGRGYGEENDFCQRAADRGYRHVAACGVLVEHRESVSFGDEKASLLATNLPMLESMYPEYTPLIIGFEKQDPLRLARRALDLHRLAASAGRFVVSVETWLGGGSARAARDLIGLMLTPGQESIVVRCRQDGVMVVEVEQPCIRAEFLPGEADALFALLDTAAPRGIVVHQLLGYDVDFVQSLAVWLKDRPSIVYLHDFYAACPRVTLIDATDGFCNMASTDVCARCVALGGDHAASRLHMPTPAAHRALFATLLMNATRVVTPSRDTAAYIRRAFPELNTLVVPHPELSAMVAAPAAASSATDIVLLGAIGPHKGSQHLLDIARRATLTHPRLRFHVVGYTNLDDELRAVGNVTISGTYTADRLPALVRATGSAVALFLHVWPETFSYTLSEAARLGLIPVVPDIGAPAERVRAAEYGVVFPFPIVATSVLEVLGGLADGVIAPGTGNLRDFLPPPEAADAVARLLRAAETARPQAARPRPRARSAQVSPT